MPGATSLTRTPIAVQRAERLRQATADRRHIHDDAGAPPSKFRQDRPERRKPHNRENPAGPAGTSQTQMLDAIDSALDKKGTALEAGAMCYMLSK